MFMNGVILMIKIVVCSPLTPISVAVSVSMIVIVIVIVIAFVIAIEILIVRTINDSNSN